MAPRERHGRRACTSSADCRHPGATLPFRSHAVYDRLRSDDLTHLLDSDYGLILRLRETYVLSLKLHIISLLGMHELKTTSAPGSDEMAVLVLDTVHTMRTVPRLFSERWLEGRMEGYEDEVYVEKVLIALVIHCQLQRLETQKLSALITEEHECQKVVEYVVSGKLRSFLAHAGRTVAAYRKKNPGQTPNIISVANGVVYASTEWAIRAPRPVSLSTDSDDGSPIVDKSLFSEHDVVVWDERIVTLYKHVRKQIEKIAALNDQIQKQDEKIATLDGQAREKDGKIAALEDQVVRLQCDSADLACSLAALQEVPEGDQNMLETCFAQTDALSKAVTRRLLENTMFRSKFGLNRKRKRAVDDDA